MLSEYQKELLTAFVDGEMTRRQRKAVLALLHQSSEARSFLRDLQENAHLFKVLWHHKLEESFPDMVLEEIAARRLKPQAPAPLPRQRSWRPMWAGVAAAAAILLAVGTWIWTRDEGNGPVPEIAKEKDVVAPRKLEIAFKDISLPEKKEELLKELAKETSVQLNLKVRDGAKAVQQLIRVLEKHKIKSDFDPASRASLNPKTPPKKDGNVQFLVYAEGVRPDEVLLMLEQLGAQGVEKGAIHPEFQSLVLTSLDPQVRPKSPVKDGAKKESKEPAPLLEKFAMVMTNSPEPGHKFSPTVQAFLDGRSEARAGTVQVLVVLTVTA